MTALPLFAQRTQPAAPEVEIVIRDVAGKPISGAGVKLSAGQTTVKSGETDDTGHVAFAGIEAGQYNLTAAKPGFETVERKKLDLTRGGTAGHLTMVPALTRSDSVEVRGTVMAVEGNASVPNTLPPKTAKELPNRPATVSD